MFTGIVEELGEVVAVEHRAATRAACRARPARHVATPARRLDRGQRRLPDRRRDGDGDVHRRRDGRDARRTQPRRARRRRPASTSSAPCALGDRLGGHIVQGHVDGVGTHRSRATPGERWEVVAVSAARASWPATSSRRARSPSTASASRSRAVDDRFTVSLIPTTLSLTTLGHKRVGDPVNLEVDVIAKYVERLLPRAAGAAAAATTPPTSAAPVAPTSAAPAAPEAEPTA